MRVPLPPYGAQVRGNYDEKDKGEGEGQGQGQHESMNMNKDTDTNMMYCCYYNS